MTWTFCLPMDDGASTNLKRLLRTSLLHRWLKLLGCLLCLLGLHVAFNAHLEVFDNPLYQAGRQGVGRDASGPRDVETDRFSFQIYHRPAALPGLQHRIMLNRQVEAFGALAEVAA